MPLGVKRCLRIAHRTLLDRFYSVTRLQIVINYTVLFMAAKIGPSKSGILTSPILTQATDVGYLEAGTACMVHSFPLQSHETLV